MKLTKYISSMLIWLLATSVIAAEDSITKLASEFESLKQLAAKAEAINKKDQYCSMRLMVIERFLQYLPNDIKQYPDLGSYSQRDIRKIIDDERKRLNLIINGDISNQKTVNRIKECLPVINGGHFQQDVIWSDGTVEKDRPVYLFGFGHFHELRKEIEWLGKLGTNFAQTEIGPRGTLKSETEIDTPRINEYKTFLAKAYKSGVLVDLLISPHYTPDWAKSKYPKLYPHLGGFLRVNIFNNTVNNILSRHINTIVEKMGDEPGLWSLCMANEPVAFIWTQVPEIRSLWENYLKDKFKTIENANIKWNTTFADWSEVPAYLQPPRTPFPQEPVLFDWMRFNDQTFSKWLVGLSDTTKLALKENGIQEKPTHMKAIDRSLKQFDLIQGIDHYYLSQYFDMNGMDGGASPAKVNSESNYAIDATQVTLHNIMLRSARMLPVVNTENHLLRDRDNNDVLPGHVRAGMWLQLLTGQHGSTAWSWERRDNVDNNIFKGLFKYRPLQTEEYVRTGLDAMRLMPYIASLAEAKPEVGILYSRASLLRNQDSMAAFTSCVAAFNELGINYAIIPEQMLETDEFSRKLPSVKVIILPGTTHVTDKALDGIDYFLKMGFHSNTAAAILIGNDVAKFNEYAQSRKHNIFNDTAVTALNLDQYESNIFPDKIKTALKSIGTYGEYQLIDSETNKPVKGIFYRYTKVEGKIIASAVNTTRSPITCVWKNNKGKKLTFKDETTLGYINANIEFTLDPLQISCGTLE